MSDQVTGDRILEALSRLSINPFEYEGVAKIRGSENKYRLRIGK